MVDAPKGRVVQLHISTGVHTGSNPVLTTKCCSLEKGIEAGRATKWYISETL